MKAPDIRPFHFKQFSLYHHRSTMKVGTDSVLLGVWTDLNGIKEALDVGTGCGILPLLLTARSNLHVDAVELDRNSFEEAGDNFAASPFSNQLYPFCADFSVFVRRSNKKYDLIISNPPFFINDRKSESAQKRQARHTDSLTYEQLIDGICQLLNPYGRISVVLPYREGKDFIRLAGEKGLFLQRQMLIFPKPCKSPNRMNIQLGFGPKPVKAEKFIIRNEDGSFTSQYISFLEDYYVSI